MFVARGVGAFGDELTFPRSVDAGVDSAVETVVREGVQRLLPVRSVFADPERKPCRLRVVRIDALTRVVEGVAIPVADEDGLVTVHLVRRKEVCLAQKRGDRFVRDHTGQFLHVLGRGGRNRVGDAEKGDAVQDEERTEEHRVSSRLLLISRKKIH